MCVCLGDRRNFEEKLKLTYSLGMVFWLVRDLPDEENSDCAGPDTPSCKVS